MLDKPNLLVYSFSKPSDLEGVGNVVLNTSKRFGKFNVSYLNLGTFRKFWFYSFLSPLFFAFNVFKLKPVIVFVHTTEASFDPIIAKKIFGFNYKIVCVAHGLVSDVLKEYLKEVQLGNSKKRLFFILNMKISSFRTSFIKECNDVIAVSSMVQKRLNEKYGANSAVIPNGIDLQVSLKSKNLSSDRILFSGNQFWLKGLHYLIKANNLIKNRKKITVIGLNPSQIFELTKLVDCSAVEFKSCNSKKEVLGEFSKGGIYAMPSVYESFGITYLQALVFGMPIIGSWGTGAEDIIVNGKNGFLVKKRDVTGIKKAILAAQKLNLNFNDISPIFYWKNIAKKYEEVLLSTL